MARQLIHPDVLDEGLRSGLFVLGLRWTGKTTFVRHDLIPALEAHGVMVIYVDLWTNTRMDPAVLVRDAVREFLHKLRAPGWALLRRLASASGLEASRPPLKSRVRLDEIGETDEATLAQVFTEMVDLAKRDLVLIVDEVQHAARTEDSNQLLLALKAARDAINSRRGTPGHFLFVGIGSQPAKVNDLTTRSSQAFYGATSISYRVLDADYVDYLLDGLVCEKTIDLPSREAALRAFRTLSHRPEEMMKAMHQLRLMARPGNDPDTFLAVIAATLRTAAAEIELAKVAQLGCLARAVFARIVSADSEVTGKISADVMAEYRYAGGREVETEEIQTVVSELTDADIVVRHRHRHGVYDVADPFVEEAWRNRQWMLS